MSSLIQTVTVGFGIGPNQPWNDVPWVAGYTAGREFHPALKNNVILLTKKVYYNCGQIARGLVKCYKKTAAFGRQGWIWYNRLVVTSQSGNRKGVLALTVLTSFVLSIIASVIAHYICKWLDRKKK